MILWQLGLKHLLYFIFLMLCIYKLKVCVFLFDTVWFLQIQWNWCDKWVKCYSLLCKYESNIAQYVVVTVVDYRLAVTVTVPYPVHPHTETVKHDFHALSETFQSSTGSKCSEVEVLQLCKHRLSVTFQIWSSPFYCINAAKSPSTLDQWRCPVKVRMKRIFCFDLIPLFSNDDHTKWTLSSL